MSRTLSVKTGSPVTLTNDDTGATALKVLDFDARVPAASATLPGGSKVVVTGSDGTNYSVPASAVASSVALELDATKPGLVLADGNPGYKALGFDRSLVPAAVLDVTPTSNAVAITAAQLLATDKIRVATGSATGAITATIEAGVSKSFFSVVNNSVYDLTVIVSGQTAGLYTLPRGCYGCYTCNGSIVAMIGQDNTANLNGSFYSTLATAGKVRGNLGSHACGPTEFAHYPLNEQSGSAIADRTGHWPGTLSGTLGFETSGLPANLASALVLDGTTNAVDFGRIDYSSWQELSVSLWFKIASDAEDRIHMLIGNNQNNCADGWNLAWIGLAGTGRLYAYHSSLNANTGVGDTCPRGVWHHAVFTVRRDVGISLIVDGTGYVAAAGVSAYSLSTNYGTKIGVRPSSNAYWAKAAVANVRIYNRALSMTEVEALYNGGAGRKTPLAVSTQLGNSPWSEVADYQTSSPSNTYQFTSSDSRLTPGTPIRYRQNNVLKYGFVIANSSGTISIGGAALSTSYPIQTLAVGAPGTMYTHWISIPGSYASGKSAGAVLLNQFWGRSTAALVGVIAKHTTADTGAIQPQVNAYVGGSAVSSLNSGNGPTLSTSAWTPPPATAGTDPVAITTANYNLVFGSEIDLKLTTTGTNKNAADLRVGLLCVMK